MQKFTKPRFIKPVSLRPEDRQRIVQRVHSLLASSEDIVFAYIYGSFARGEPVRDLDVALYTIEALVWTLPEYWHGAAGGAEVLQGARAMAQSTAPIA